jgi:hypothetical protein
MLLEHGASFNVHNAKGFSPIDKALQGIDTKFANSLFRELFSSTVEASVKHQLWQKLVTHHTFDPQNCTVSLPVC